MFVVPLPPGCVGGRGGTLIILHTHMLGQILGVLNFEFQYLWGGGGQKK